MSMFSETHIPTRSDITVHTRSYGPACIEAPADEVQAGNGVWRKAMEEHLRTMTYERLAH